MKKLEPILTTVRGKEIYHEHELLEPVNFIEAFIWIKGKQKKKIPFIMNPVQYDYMMNRTLRDIILKARQHGFTTLVLADMYVDTITNEATKTKIVAHKKRAAEELLQNLKVMYELTPDEWKPRLGNDNKYEFEFPELESKILIDVATQSGDAGRSETINNLLCTEVAFWRGASDTMGGLIDAVPQGGRIVIESTPNGIGNYYHGEVLKARAGDSAFKLHEYGWWINPEYMRPLIKGMIEARSKEELELALEYRRLILDPEEEKLKKRLGLTFEQINWRRWKIKQAPNVRKFYQENELNFNQSGRPVIDYQYLEPFKDGEKKRAPILSDVYERWWEAPVAAGGRYYVGVDTSEGIDGGDYSVIQIGRHCADYKIRQVYRYRARIKPGQLAVQVDKIVRRFAQDGKNKVILGPERNNHGHAVILKLQEFGTPGLYYFDAGKPGWDTNGATKYTMIHELEEAFRDGMFETYDDVTLGELQAVEWKNNGSWGAPERGGDDEDGFHDDTVTSLAIMYQMRKATDYHIFWPYGQEESSGGASVFG